MPRPPGLFPSWIPQPFTGVRRTSSGMGKQSSTALPPPPGLMSPGTHSQHPRTPTQQPEELVPPRCGAGHRRSLTGSFTITGTLVVPLVRSHASTGRGASPTGILATSSPSSALPRGCGGTLHLHLFLRVS